MQSGSGVGTTTTTITTSTQTLDTEPETTVVLHPTAESEETSKRRRVVWTEDTVDNEDMNKKKSKCCCIFEKRRNFGESDSDTSDDECEHCFGHVEKKREKRIQKLQSNGASTSTQTAVQDECNHLQTVTFNLKPQEKSEENNHNGKDDDSGKKA